MNRRLTIVAVGVAIVVLAQGCASSRNTMTFEPGVIDADVYG
jgi:hypothetical protein